MERLQNVRDDGPLRRHFRDLGPPVPVVYPLGTPPIAAVHHRYPRGGSAGDDRGERGIVPPSLNLTWTGAPTRRPGLKILQRRPRCPPAKSRAPSGARSALAPRVPPTQQRPHWSCRRVGRPPLIPHARRALSTDALRGVRALIRVEPEAGPRASGQRKLERARLGAPTHTESASSPVELGSC